MTLHRLIQLTFSLSLAILSCHNIYAQQFYGDEENTLPKVDKMQWINENYLQKQRVHINDIARDKFAKFFHGNIGDMRLLQRFVNSQVLDKTDKQSLQALGVILGDIYTQKNKHLKWAVYEDELGRTHAVCIENTKQCLFVMTMLSRRMEVGLKPNVQTLFDENFNEIKGYLPKRAYNPY